MQKECRECISIGVVCEAPVKGEGRVLITLKELERHQMARAIENCSLRPLPPSGYWMAIYGD